MPSSVRRDARADFGICVSKHRATSDARCGQATEARPCQHAVVRSAPQQPANVRLPSKYWVPRPPTSIRGVGCRRGGAGVTEDSEPSVARKVDLGLRLGRKCTTRADPLPRLTTDACPKPQTQQSLHDSAHDSKRNAVVRVASAHKRAAESLALALLHRLVEHDTT